MSREKAMDNGVAHRTFGEDFLLSLQNAESKGLMFAVVEETASRYYPQYNLLVQLAKISDFNSVAAYHDKLARVRIQYNARAVGELQQRLVGLNNLGSEDNYRYKEKMVRKLNLLINNHPTLEEILYISVSSYIMRGYGPAEKFKRELKEHYIANKGSSPNAEMLAIDCGSAECRV